MPVTDHGEIIPSFLPEDNTQEKILEDLKRLGEILDAREGVGHKKECPIESEPFFSDGDDEELLEEACADEEIPHEVIPDAPEPEIIDESACVSEGISAIQDAAKDVANDAKRLSDIKEIIPILEEWVYNMEPMYYYHKARFKHSDNKNALKIEEAADIAAQTIKLTLYPEFCTAMAAYSTAVLPNPFSIENVIYPNFHFQWTDKINESNVLQKNEKDVFTKQSSSVKFGKYNEKVHSHGVLYDQYYKLMEHPEDNFFTLEERGLVADPKDAFIIQQDDRLETQTSKYIEVKSDGKTYYVGNNDKKLSNGKTRYQTYSEFYSSVFPNEFDRRKKKEYEKLKKRIVFKTLKESVELVGSAEGELVNRYSDKHKASKEFINRYEDANRIIDKLQLEAKKIEMGLTKDAIIDKINKNVSSKGSDCLKKFTVPKDVESPQDNDNLDGYAAYLSPFGGDPTLPDFTKLCYWVKFCELATIYNATSPYPDLENPASMRYWPVGIVIPTPAGLLKIPFPTVFVPLLVVTVTTGTFVIFLAQTGIFPAIDVMYMSNDGSKSFILGLSVSSLTSGKINSDDFGFSAESELELLQKFPTLKLFMLPIINDLQKIEIAKKRLEDPLGYAYSKLDYAYDLDEEMSKPKDIMKEIEEWRSLIINKIYDIPDKEYAQINLDEIDKVRTVAKEIFNSIDWPVFKFPKSIEDLETEPIVSKTIEQIKELMSMKVGIIKRPETLNQIVTEKVSECFEDERVQEILQKLPEEINLGSIVSDFADGKKKEAQEKIPDVGSPEENLKKFKDFVNEFLDYVKEKLDRNLWHNDALNDALKQMAAVNVGNPFKCEKAIDIVIPSLDPFISLFNSLKTLVMSAITLDLLKKIIPGLPVFRREQSLNVLLSIIDAAVPPIPLIDVTGTLNALGASWSKLMFDLSSILISASSITIDDVKDMVMKKVISTIGLPITIDTKMFVNPLFEQFMELYDKNVASVEKYNGMKFSNAFLKGILVDSVNNVFGQGSAIIAPYVKMYEDFMKIYMTLKALRNANIDFNPIDIVVNPVETAKKLAKRVSTADLKQKIKEKLKLDRMNIDVAYIKIAVALLEQKLGPLLEYHLIGMACAFGGQNAASIIRVIHPISFGEDTPPYERLKLNNPLFVVFLDGFCHEAKKLNGYSENFI